MNDRDHLLELARLHGIETAYTDARGRTHVVSPESLHAILRSLGVDLTDGYASAIRAKRVRRTREVMPPVQSCWDGEGVLRVRLPEAKLRGHAVATFVDEAGDVLTRELNLAEATRTSGMDFDGEHIVDIHLPLPPLSPGYHHVQVELGSERFTGTLISAPRISYSPEGERHWGIFVPVYALGGEGGTGMGDFGHFKRLTEWAARLGASLVGTLPLLPVFLEELYDPSPYAAISRLFWNELFIDLNQVPEMSRSDEARKLFENPAFRTEIHRLRLQPDVDYRAQAEMRRRVLEALCETLHRTQNTRRDEFERFCERHPTLLAYARFRAMVSERKEGFRSWPTHCSAEHLSEENVDPKRARYHRYAQWIAHTQLESLAAGAKNQGLGLYLDFPVGVHPDGFDMWLQPDLWTINVSVGAPPDGFFVLGQDWGFAPIHPERSRETAHRYIRQCLQHHMRYAGVLRVDHVMAWHRLFWIPRGMKPSEGTYVRYSAEDFYAIASLESHRNHCVLVGEDLGTVPDETRHDMATHRVRRMYVLQFESQPHGLSPPSQNALASLDTHDTATFPAFWNGDDLITRMTLGMLTPEEEQKERADRETPKRSLVNALASEGLLDASSELNAQQVTNAALRYLAQSEAEMVVVNLEDLWGETTPQNIPGTSTERSNWTHKMALTIEELFARTDLREVLQEIDARRRKTRATHGM